MQLPPLIGQQSLRHQTMSRAIRDLSESDAQSAFAALEDWTSDLRSNDFHFAPTVAKVGEELIRSNNIDGFRVLEATARRIGIQRSKLWGWSGAYYDSDRVEQAAEHHDNPPDSHFRLRSLLGVLSEIQQNGSLIGDR
ncbi:hypothetical protein ROE7235_03201 [Roseibaca ekhonensis]|uniref:Uncharacterized protein n=1 Tax=Roseinatronobacter ekhonensis TaxID=254356 RepID=A0A3B0MC68_9RHOB|nr:hypothetical protein ROE7235_03201 [Roseibaca ekhonensis]